MQSLASEVATAPQFEPDDPGASEVDHSRFEDAYGILIGSALVAWGLCMLKHGGLVTGGSAGLALLASYLVPLSPGVLLSLINIPFFLFAWRTMGPRFTLKSLASNLSIIVISAVANASMDMAVVQPAFTAVMSGTLIGMGVLCLARHRAGVGGTGIIAMWLYKTRGWNIGVSQGAMDAGIILLAIPVVSPGNLLWSAASALAVGLVLFVWHRPGRYFTN